MIYITRASYSNQVNFLVVNLSGAVFERDLNTKSKFHILNLIGQENSNVLPLGQSYF